MAKLFVSLCVALSVFAFVCVNGQDKYTIPQFVAPITAGNFIVAGSGTEYDVTDFSRDIGKVPVIGFSTILYKIGSHTSFKAEKDDYSHAIDNVNVPLGLHVYRDDVKKLFSYPPVGSGANNAIHRCEDKGASTTEGALNKFMDYIDPAHAVRGKAIFTNKAQTTYMMALAFEYSYTEEKDITGYDNYDKIQITHTYTILNSTQMCVKVEHVYRRHIKGGDYEISTFATNSFSVSIRDSKTLTSEEDLLKLNYDEADDSKYDHNGLEYIISPNVVVHSSSNSFVCPEIDFLPRIPLIKLLTSGNYSEYEFVLDNPVYVERLVKDTAKILNLTANNEEYKVGFDGINKIGGKWSVDLVIPSKYAEALATAIENGDIKKSELPVISKVKKMNKKN